MFKFFDQSSANYWIASYDNSPDSVESDIESLASLSNGWHFGEGVPPTKEAIDYAIEVYRAGKHTSLESSVFPSIHGGVIVTFYGKDKHCVEISIGERNILSISYEIGHGFDYTEDYYKENPTISDVKKQCQKLSTQKKLNLSESYIREYMILSEEDSPATVSKIQPATEEFPSLIYNVSRNFTTPQYVNI